ncbi:unnamed protein product [Amoebophrya sp. A120]|nr:unnamed protein product [Amoebophrya sp. A120]|eukprot:GSA120T00017353001.1
MKRRKLVAGGLSATPVAVAPVARLFPLLFAAADAGRVTLQDLMQTRRRQYPPEPHTEPRDVSRRTSRDSVSSEPRLARTPTTSTSNAHAQERPRKKTDSMVLPSGSTVRELMQSAAQTFSEAVHTERHEHSSKPSQQEAEYQWKPHQETRRERERKQRESTAGANADGSDAVDQFSPSVAPPRKLSPETATTEPASAQISAWSAAPAMHGQFHRIPGEDGDVIQTQTGEKLRLTVLKVAKNNMRRRTTGSDGRAPDRQLSGGSSSAEAQRVWALRNGIPLPNPECANYHTDRTKCRSTPGCTFESEDQYFTQCLPTSLGWRVAEVEFYSNEGCTALLTPVSFKSEPVQERQECEGLETDERSGGKGKPTGYCKCRETTGSSRAGANKAFDGFTNTVWVAPCCNCGKREAALGVDFGTPEVVQCVRIWQVEGYFSPNITLAREGTSQARDKSLWSNVITWGEMDASGLPKNEESSGIQTALKDAIKFSIVHNTHCRRFIYGPMYTEMERARNYCISDPLCGAVYEYSCSEWEYTVQITSADELDQLATALSPAPRPHEPASSVTGTTTVSTQRFYPVVDYPKIVNKVHLVRHSRLLAPLNSTRQLARPDPKADPFPAFTAELSVKPGYGKLQFCAVDYVSDVSDEGSCLHHKTGALLEFRTYTNLMAAPEKYQYRQLHCATPTDGGCSASKCAEQCLLAAPTVCSAFQYVARRNGERQTLCQLLTLPPYPDFAPPAGLLRLDGTLDVTDFYYRYLSVNDTATVEKAGGTWSSGAEGRKGHLVLWTWSAFVVSVAVIFASSTSNLFVCL